MAVTIRAEDSSRRGPALSSEAGRGGPARTRLVPWLVCVLLIGGLIAAHVLIGGVKLLFSGPAYILLGVGALLLAALPLRKLAPGIRGWPMLATLALGAYVLARSYSSPVEYLGRVDRMNLLGVLAVYGVTAFCVTSVKQRLWVIISLFLLAAVGVGCGLAQFFRQDNFMLLGGLPDSGILPPILRPDAGPRASGFLGSPNHFAGFLEVVGLLAVTLTCLGRWRATPRLVIGALAAVCMVGLAFTGSRGGYLSTAAGIVAFLLVLGWVVKKLRRKRFLLIWMISLITGAAAVVGSIALMNSDVLLRKRVEDVVDTGDIRRELWGAAVRQFQLAPWLGTGSGTHVYYARRFRDPSLQDDAIYAHSDHLQFLAEYGVIGAVLALAFVVTHFRSAGVAIGRMIRRRLRPAKRIFSDEMAIQIGAIAAGIALLAHAIVDFNSHVPGNALLYAFVFGLMASPSADPRIHRNDSKGLYGLGRVVFPAVGAALVLATVWLYRGEFHAEWARVKLRNKTFVDHALNLHHQLSRGLPALASRTPFPSDAGDSIWRLQLTRVVAGEAASRAEQAVQADAENPNAWFTLGQARYLEAMAAADSRRQGEGLAASEKAFRQGRSVAPQDTALMFGLGRVLSDLGEFDEAQKVLARAIESDPNLGNGYAFYGYSLWSQRKLVRAEAYLRKALSLNGKAEFAASILDTIARLRILAKDPEYVDAFGDPMESFDLEPPTADDELRGVRINE